MKTRKTISTISFNTPAFLRLKLEELRKAKIITVWFFISHQPEEDEKKAHIHLWILPSKTIQTDDLITEFYEKDPDPKQKIPLKCLSFQPCNSFADWYLYALHDPAYLLRKGQKRKYRYSDSDIVCSDRDELERLVSEIDMTEGSAIGRLLDALNDGISFTEYIKRGSVPLQQFSQYKAAWDFLVESGTFRNGRTTHSPLQENVNSETGEVLDSDKDESEP